MLNPDGVCGGVQAMTVDGRRVPGNLIPLTAGKGTVHVEVVLGAEQAAEAFG